MLIHKVYPSKIVVLSIAVAAVLGHKPIVGFTEEVEKLWEKLKEKFGLKERINKRKYGSNPNGPGTKRSNSVTQLDEFVSKPPSTEPVKYKRQTSDAKVSLAKFKKLDEDAQTTYYTDDVYSPFWTPPKFDKNAPDYGRPKKGSLTEKRGIEAGNHICKEILYLCETIDENGTHNKDGTVTIIFGKLFSIYVYISDKVVGMLLRARRHKIVAFDGEMLYQRQDDNVPITLLRSMDEVRQFYAASNDPARCVSTL